MKRVDSIELHVGHIVTVEITPLMEEAIQVARAARLAGQTKVDSVKLIFPKIAKIQKEEIWYTIIHGVNLSSRGAVTYYYNMKRLFRLK